MTALMYKDTCTTILEISDHFDFVTYCLSTINTVIPTLVGISVSVGRIVHLTEVCYAIFFEIFCI